MMFASGREAVTLAIARFCGARGGGPMLDRVLPDLEPERPCTYTSGPHPEPLVNWPGERGITRCPGIEPADCCCFGLGALGL